MAKQKEMTQEERLAAWEAQPRSITLTNDQCSTLTIYILMTTQHRKHEREGWAKLAEEFKGEKLGETAASNAQYYAELEDKLEAIRKILDF